jgi:predicted hotdog family 3-hydroxylacyl-ACP dehydratase
MSIDLSILVPHQGSMCLNQRVLESDTQRIRLATRSHLSEENPLRSGKHLHALHLCEYGAQAMAAHGALLARESLQRARAGLLVSLREVQLHVEHIDALDREIEIEAECLMQSDLAWQYRFRATHQNTLLAEGRAAVMFAAEGES